MSDNLDEFLHLTLDCMNQLFVPATSFEIFALLNVRTGLEMPKLKTLVYSTLEYGVKKGLIRRLGKRPSKLAQNLKKRGVIKKKLAKLPLNSSPSTSMVWAVCRRLKAAERRRKARAIPVGVDSSLESMASEIAFPYIQHSSASIATLDDEQDNLVNRLEAFSLGIACLNSLPSLLMQRSRSHLK